MTEMSSDDWAALGSTANATPAPNPADTANPPAAASSDDWASLGASAQGVSPDRLKVAGDQGIIQDPARAAKVLDLSERTKLPSELIAKNFQAVDDMSRQVGFDADQFRKTSPIVAQWLSEDPTRVGLTRDDLPQLQQLEGLVRNSPYYRYLPGGQIIETNGAQTGRTFDNIQQFRQQMNRDQLSDLDQEVHEQSLQAQMTFFGAHGGWLGRQADQVMMGFGAELAGLTGSLAALVPGTQEQTDRAFRSEQEVLGEAEKMQPGIIGSLERSTGQLVADAPLMLLGGPIAKAGQGLGMLIARGRAVQPILSHLLAGAGAMQPFAVRGALEQGHDQGWSSGLESWAIDSGIAGAFGPIGASRAAMRLMGIGADGAAAVSAPAQGAARLLLTQSGLQASQMASFALGHAIQQYATGADPHALDWQNLGAQLGSQGLLGGLMGGVFSLPEAFGHAAAITANAKAEDIRKIGSSLAFTDRMTQIEQTLANTKALTLHQGSIRDVVQRMADAGTTPDLHIDAEQWQSHFTDAKQDPAQAAAEFGLQGYHQAVATGGQLRVPYGTWSTQIANGAHGEWFKEHMRERPDALSGVETQARLEELKKAIAAKAPAELGAKPMDDDTAGEAMVFEDFKRQELASGVDETAAEASALPYAKIVTKLAKLTGVDPWEFHQTRGAKVRAAMPDLLSKNPLDVFATNLAARVKAGDIPTEADISNAMQQPPEGGLQGEDIIDAVKRLGGIRARPTGEAGFNAGEYEGRVNHPAIRGTEAPDIMATQLEQEGFHTGGDTNRMWELLRQAQEGRRAAKRAEPTHTDESRRLLEQREAGLAGQQWLQQIGADIEHETPEQLAERIRTGIRGDAQPMEFEGKQLVAADIPYAAGTSADGKTIYIDRRIPRFLTVDGKRVDVWKLIALHETRERERMDAGEPYQDAHNWAEDQEHEQEDHQGLKHADYEKIIAPYVERAREMARKELIPTDLHTKPYEDMGEQALIEGRSGPAANEADRIYEQAAFHGTANIDPYEGFDITKVGGTGGEGTQMEGHGLYVTEGKEAGTFYRDQNTERARGRPTALIDGARFDIAAEYLIPFPEDPSLHDPREREVVIQARRYFESAFHSAIDRGPFNALNLRDQALDEIDTMRARAKGMGLSKDSLAFHLEALDQASMTIESLDHNQIKPYFPERGRLYHLEIPDHGYLDFSKSFRAHPQDVQDAITKSFPDVVAQVHKVEVHTRNPAAHYVTVDGEPQPGVHATREGAELHAKILEGRSGEFIYRQISKKLGSDKAASEALDKAGIVGNKYLGDEKKGPYHNYVLFHDRHIKITKFEQTGDDAPRGSYSALQRLITLERGADRSTVLHEIGHWALETITAIADGPNAPPSIVADVAKLRAWMGLEEGRPYDEASHEQFARAWERFLMEGVAPSRDLRGAFARISRWIAHLYANAKDYFRGADLNPEVRGIFDRLLASDEEIAQAKGQDAPVGKFTDQASAAMSNEEWAAYQRNLQASSNQAQDLLDQEYLAPLRAKAQAAYERTKAKVRLEMATEINQQRVYTAMLVMQRGAWPEGVDVPEGLEKVKLSKQDIVRRFGEAGLDQLPGPQRAGAPPKANQGRVMYTEDARGKTLDAAAQDFGFRSGGELWTALTTAPDRQKLIDARTEQEMAKRYPDPIADGSGEDLARDALVNDARFRAMEQEAEAIARQQGRKATPHELIAALAHRTILDSPSARLNPEAHRTAMVKAGRLAAEAIGAKQWEKADKFQEQERMNGALYRAAREYQNQSAAWKTYLETFSDLKKRQRLGKAGGDEYVVTWTDAHGADQSRSFKATDHVSDPAGAQGMSPEIADDVMRQARLQAGTAAADFAREQGPTAQVARSGPLEQIDQLLADHQLEPVSNKVLQRRESLRKYLTRKAKEDDAVDPTLAGIENDLQNLHWQEMTLDQQSKLVDAVKQLERIAQQRNRFFRAADQAEFADEKEKWLDSMAEHGPARRNAPAEKSWLGKKWEAIGQLINEWATTTRLARQWDGFSDNGPMSRIWTHSIHDANADQLGMEGESGRALAQLRKDLGKSDFALSHREYEPAVNQSLSRWARIMVALNWGNADNRARILTGFKWSPEQVHAILAKLDAKDMQFVQGVLDHINSYWPLIKAKMERVTGVAAEKVDAIPIQHASGVYRGGYFPIAYDPTSIARDMLADMEAKALRSGARLVASTRRGHEQARTEAPQGARVLLDPAVVGNHIQQVVHDLAFHETVLDLNRFLRDSDVHDEIVSRHGNGVYRTFQNQLRDLAAGAQYQRSAFGKILEGMRVNVNLASRGFNLMTAAQQLAGFPQALGRVGPKYFFKAFSVMLHQSANLESCFKYVDDKSVEMAGRGTSRDKTVMDSMGGLSVTGGWKKTIVGAAMWPWMKAFQLLDTHTWIAAHLKALDEGVDEHRAIAIADSTVAQIQGSGALKDLPELMRKGPFVQVFTGNMSWYNALWNQTAHAANRIGYGARAGDIAHVMKGVGELTVLYGMLPIAWAAASAALTGKDADKWKDPAAWGGMMAKEEAYGIASEFPFLRDLGSTIEDGSSYNGPQGLRSLEYIANAVRTIQPPAESSSQSWTAKEETEHAMKVFSKAAGVFGGLPATAFWQVFDGVTQAERDGTNPLWHALVGPDQSKPRP